MMTRTNVQILKSDLPNISTQGQLFLDIRKTEKLMKNQTVAKKWGEKKGDEEMDAISKEMRKYDQNALVMLIFLLFVYFFFHRNYFK